MDNVRKSKVLIVDDMWINRMLLASLLSSAGVGSDLAESGKECIELCEKNVYDLILLDHRMPEIDGVDTLLSLKRMFRQSGHDIPIVCHTTEDARDNINLYKAAGFADVLIKPIQPQKLFDILMTYLPESREGNMEKTGKEEERLRSELALLPGWLLDVTEINIAAGLENCETAGDYLDAITIFQASAGDKADEIERLCLEGDYAMYTTKVHSLKSMSILIGAEKLSDMAYELECAGRHDDYEAVKRNTPSLLSEYRRLGAQLSPVDNAGAVGKKLHTDKVISDGLLSDAYESISDCIASYDDVSMESVLRSLEEYTLPPDVMGNISKTRDALYSSDWKTLRELYGVKGVNGLI